MEKQIDRVYRILQRMVGLHRQLLECVRTEREALVSADIKKIADVTGVKQALIETVRSAEAERLGATAALALQWRKPIRELTLNGIAIELQGREPQTAAQFRSVLNTLTILLQHIQTQNDDNSEFLKKSLEHVSQMKQNVLCEAVPKSNTYTAHGQRAGNAGGARLISKEA